MATLSFLEQLRWPFWDTVPNAPQEGVSPAAKWQVVFSCSNTTLVTVWSVILWEVCSPPASFKLGCMRQRSKTGLYTSLERENVESAGAFSSHSTASQSLLWFKCPWRPTEVTRACVHHLQAWQRLCTHEGGPSDYRWRPFHSQAQGCCCATPRDSSQDLPTQQREAPPGLLLAVMVPARPSCPVLIWLLGWQRNKLQTREDKVLCFFLQGLSQKAVHSSCLQSWGLAQERSQEISLGSELLLPVFLQNFWGKRLIALALCAEF